MKYALKTRFIPEKHKNALENKTLKKLKAHS